MLLNINKLLIKITIVQNVILLIYLNKYIFGNLNKLSL